MLIIYLNQAWIYR